MVDFQRYRATLGETNFIERIRAPIFLETVLAVEIMQEPQSNLEEKDNLSILKDDFFSRTTRSFVRYSHQFFYFLLFLLAFTSADYHSSQIIRTSFNIISKKNFSHKFPFLTDLLNAPLPPPPPPSQQPKSAKLDKSFLSMLPNMTTNLVHGNITSWMQQLATSVSCLYIYICIYVYIYIYIYII